MTRDDGQLINETLLQPAAAIPYHLSRRLSELFGDRAIVEGSDHSFGLEQYAAAGHCTLTFRAQPHPQRDSHWAGPKLGMIRRAVCLWYEVRWQGNRIDVLLLQWGGDMHGGYRHYVLAESEALADQFIASVCRWNSELRDEVLVFEAGHWQKDSALFHDIRGATLENLVLRGNLKHDIVDDMRGFFGAQETYQRYGVPWKRGILFVGPPGNGKTHAVKALVNALAQDCLYVKSFRSQMPEEYSIHSVFARARMSAPCILVLEDLDSLVNTRNRSFFLNELDGFAGNEGILTLATTNHPERLDPAIVDRPSRFDRKYPFDLPGPRERAAYIGMWNDTLQPELRLSDEGVGTIAKRTDEFSFAYLKELFVSATMGWINLPAPVPMDEVMPEQVQVLRAQMASAIIFDAGSADEGEADYEGEMGHLHMHGSAQREWLFHSGQWGDPLAWDEDEVELE
jgi:ATPase family associated with various cellular activities (AAA)